jgi:hypothetical protein
MPQAAAYWPSDPFWRHRPKRAEPSIAGQNLERKRNFANRHRAILRRENEDHFIFATYRSVIRAPRQKFGSACPNTGKCLLLNTLRETPEDFDEALAGALDRSSANLPLTVLTAIERFDWQPVTFGFQQQPASD